MGAMLYGGVEIRDTEGEFLHVIGLCSKLSVCRFFARVRVIESAVIGKKPSSPEAIIRPSEECSGSVTGEGLFGKVSAIKVPVHSHTQSAYVLSFASTCLLSMGPGECVRRSRMPLTSAAHISIYGWIHWIHCSHASCAKQLDSFFLSSFSSRCEQLADLDPVPPLVRRIASRLQHPWSRCMSTPVPSAVGMQGSGSLKDSLFSLLAKASLLSSSQQNLIFTYLFPSCLLNI